MVTQLKKGTIGKYQVEKCNASGLNQGALS